MDAQQTANNSSQPGQTSPLRELHLGDRFYAQKVCDLFAHAAPTRRAAVGVELTRLANELTTQSWLDAARPRVIAANTAAGLQPNEAQLQAQLEEWRTELIARVLDAMRCTGAPDSLKFALEIARDKSAPPERRKAALRLLDDIVSPSDLPVITQREAARADLAKLAAEERAAEANPSSNVPRVVAQMREPFRLCFQEQLAHAPGSYRGVATFTVKPSGEASSVAVSDLPAAMAACIEAVIRASRFAPSPEARGVQVPLTFVPESQNAASENITCLRYEPALVELTGTLERRDYAGPPNYESIAHGDAKETTWLLRLDRPACTEDGQDPSNAARIGIRLLQLVFDPAEHPYEKYRALMGKQIVAHGSLFAAQTGHHHTDVLITVRELAAAT